MVPIFSPGVLSLVHLLTQSGALYVVHCYYTTFSYLHLFALTAGEGGKLNVETI